MLGGKQPLLGALQLGLGRGRLGGALRLDHQALELILPALFTGQPDASDGIDEIGQRPDGDPRPERVVALDGATHRRQRRRWGCEPA